MNEIRPLGVTLSARDIQPCHYWLEKLTQIDRLLVKNYRLDEGLPIAYQFFKEHQEYTHFLFLLEDAITTPSILHQILEDQKSEGFKVISGYTNYTLVHDWVNLSQKDLSKTPLVNADSMALMNKEQLGRGVYGYPFIKVYHCGWSCELVAREVMEKLTFRPLVHRILDLHGFKADCGVFWDLAFSIDVNKLGYGINVDVRAGILHMADSNIKCDLKGKKRYVELTTTQTTKRLVSEEEPYC